MLEVGNRVEIIYGSKNKYKITFYIKLSNLYQR